MKKNKELNFFIYLDLIKKCYEFPIFNEFLNLFPQMTKLNYQSLKIKEYKDLIDKISSNEFENKLKKNEETKKNIQYLHQIILIFYYKIGEYDKFKEYFINKALFSELFSIQNFFSYLDSDIISLIIDNDKITTYQFIYDSLIKSRNLEELLRIINNKLERIVNLLFEFQEIFIFKSENLKLSSDDNIESIVELYIDCIQKQGNNKRIILDDNIWFTYIIILKNTQVEKLFTLYKIISVLDKESQKDFKDQIFISIEGTFQDYIEKNNLKNLSMLKYLVNNLEKNNKIKINQLSLEFEKYIDLSSIDDEFINEFKESDFCQYFKLIENKINILIGKVTNLNEFLIIFRLFTKYINEKINSLKGNLISKFEDLLKFQNKNKTQFIISDFSNLITQIINNVPNIYKEIFLSIQKLLNKEEIILIYKYILNNEIKVLEIKKHLIDYLINQNVFTEETLNDFFSSINEQNKIQFLKQFGDNNKKIITKNDFFDGEDCENLKFILIFQSSNVFLNENFYEIEYVKNIKNQLLALSNDLK